MDSIPKPVLDIIAAGVVIFLLKDIFKFVKWVVEKMVPKPIELPSETARNGGASKAVVDALGKVETKLAEVGVDVNAIHVELGVMKTTMVFIAEKQKAINGDFKELSSKVEEMRSSCQRRWERCDETFARREP